MSKRKQPLADLQIQKYLKVEAPVTKHDKRLIVASLLTEPGRSRQAEDRSRQDSAFVGHASLSTEEGRICPDCEVDLWLQHGRAEENDHTAPGLYSTENHETEDAD